MADRTRRRMLRKGSVPLFVHGLAEYGEGILLLVGPFLFSFETDGATVVSVLLGAAVLVLAVITEAPTGVARTLPVASHIVLDYVLVLFLIAFPFVFGFRDDGPALALFLVLGVAHLLLSITTRFSARDTIRA